VPDDNTYFHAEVTMGVVPHLELVATIATATTLEWKFSDGRTVSYPRDPIDIGSLKFSYKKTPNGKYFYEYTFDNRQVQMIRVGEFDHHFGPRSSVEVGNQRFHLPSFANAGQPILRGPGGWRCLGVGWFPSWSDPVIRTETAKYTILSDNLPGPLPLHVTGAERVREDFALPFNLDDPWERHLMQQVQMTISQYGISADPMVIGPAFQPKPAEQDVRDRIHRLVQLYGFGFLRPLDDASVNLKQAQNAVVPGTDFEVQILACLRVAIRAMIPDNPGAPQIEKARVGRKLRSRLAARGVTTAEQAKIRLRSLRATLEILNILLWKASGVQQYGPCQADIEARDLRLIALTKAKTFLKRWPIIAERLSDQSHRKQFISGVSAATERIGKRIEALHLAYDLKVSTEFCQAELARACAANLAKIQTESVVGIHLSDEESRASLLATNWQLIDQASYGSDIRRRFNCQAGKHQLRADVWTDFTDETIEGISLELAVQVVVRYPDGFEKPRMLDGNLVTLLLDQGWELGKSLLQYPTM
jgi:hypothetical protein